MQIHQRFGIKGTNIRVGSIRAIDFFHGTGIGAIQVTATFRRLRCVPVGQGLYQCFFLCRAVAGKGSAFCDAW